MHNRDLQSLYDTTEEDLRYGIGLLAIPGRGPVPLIGVHYSDWPWDKLEMIRLSLHEGIVLSKNAKADGKFDIHLATRHKIVIQSECRGHTSVLRAPAWNAHLTGVDAKVFRRFEDGRRKCGGFLLLVQAGEWEFTALVNDGGRRPQVGPIMPRSDTPQGDA